MSLHPDAFELEDFDPMTMTTSTRDSRRLCQVHQQQQQLLHGHNHSHDFTGTASHDPLDASGTGAVNVARISTEKLLEASLQSLETISKRQSMSSTLPSNVSQHRSFSQSQSFGQSMLGHPSHASHALDLETSMVEESGNGTVANYPSASYLRGALWIGRNMTLISEELAEKLESYRVQCLSEISEIARDVDSRRRCHRLTVHANNIISHVCHLTAQSQSHIRKMLQVSA